MCVQGSVQVVPLGIVEGKIGLFPTLLSTTGVVSYMSHSGNQKLVLSEAHSTDCLNYRSLRDSHPDFVAPPALSAFPSTSSRRPLV